MDPPSSKKRKAHKHTNGFGKEIVAEVGEDLRVVIEYDFATPQKAEASATHKMHEEEDDIIEL